MGQHLSLIFIETKLNLFTAEKKKALLCRDLNSKSSKPLNFSRELATYQREKPVQSGELDNSALQ